MVLVDGNVPVTDGRLWYQLGRLGRRKKKWIRSLPKSEQKNTAALYRDTFSDSSRISPSC